MGSLLAGAQVLDTIARSIGKKKLGGLFSL